MRLAIAATSLGAVAVIGYFVWAFTQDSSGGDQQAVCGLVIDRTGSASAETTREQYEQMATATVDGCREYDARLSVYHFDQARQKLILDDTFELWLPPGTKDAVQRDELEETTENARAAVSRVFDEESGDARSSDILTAMGEAADDVASQARRDGVDERYLVLVTDGIQISSDISVEDLGDEQADVEPLVTRARDLGLVSPGIEGTQFSFVGVRSGVSSDGAELPEWFEANVEKFWRQIVDDGGGSMCRYSIGSRTLPDSC